MCSTQVCKLRRLKACLGIGYVCVREQRCVLCIITMRSFISYAPGYFSILIFFVEKIQRKKRGVNRRHHDVLSSRCCDNNLEETRQGAIRT